jgi:hypothetical protein
MQFLTLKPRWQCFYSEGHKGQETFNISTCSELQMFIMNPCILAWYKSYVHIMIQMD